MSTEKEFLKEAKATAVKIIYMDLDGVAANWDKAAMALFGYEGREQTYWDELVDLISQKYNVNKKKATGIMWSRINAQGADWWENIEFYEMGLELYEACWAVAPVVFVTSPSTAPSSAAGKMAWVSQMAPAFTELRYKKRYFFDQYMVKAVRRCLAITPAKAMLAGPSKLLVDDTLTKGNHRVVRVPADGPAPNAAEGGHGETDPPSSS